MELNLTKQQIILMVVSVSCLALTYYSLTKDKEDKLPFADNLEFFLPALGGGAYAINFLFKLAN